VLDEAIANSRVRLVGDPAPFFKAFAAAQAEFEPVKKDAKADLGQYGYSYAPLENLLAATLPALNRHGLCLLQPFAGKVGGGHELRTWIAHESGTRLEMETDIPRADKIQQLGSSITYLRRYTVQAALGINGEDDDYGNQADGNQASIKRNAPPRAPQPSAAPPKNGNAKAEDDKVTPELLDKIRPLFKQLGFTAPAVNTEIKTVTGKDSALAMTQEDGVKLLDHLKALVEKQAAGAAS